jgi:hypothetical protein
VVVGANFWQKYPHLSKFKINGYALSFIDFKDIPSRVKFRSKCVFEDIKKDDTKRINNLASSFAMSTQRVSKCYDYYFTHAFDPDYNLLGNITKLSLIGNDGSIMQYVDFFREQILKSLTKIVLDIGPVDEKTINGMRHIFRNYSEFNLTKISLYIKLDKEDAIESFFEILAVHHPNVFFLNPKLRQVNIFVGFSRQSNLNACTFVPDSWCVHYRVYYSRGIIYSSNLTALQIRMIKKYSS